MALVKEEYGYKLRLASSAPLKEIHKNLKAVGVENIFDAVISGSDHLKVIDDPQGTNKPQPYIYQRLTKWMNVDPKSCAVLEDTDARVQAGAMAGLFVIAFLMILRVTILFLWLKRSYPLKKLLL